MENVLLLGGTGFIGSNIIKYLKKERYKIFVLELPGKIHDTNDDVTFFYGKLEQIELVKKIVVDNSINIVMHLASSLIPSSDIDAYLNEFEIIIKPTITLLPFFAKSNVRFIFFSSGGTVYGTNKSGIFSESSKTNPISYYGHSKLILEESILLEGRISNLNYLIIRPSNPYGVGQNIFGKQGLIAASIGHLLNGEKISIWGDGTVVRDYINIEDLAKGVVGIIENVDNNQIFNIGSGKGYSVNEIIDILKKCSVADFEVEYLEGRPVDVPVMILNVKKFCDIVGDTKICIEDGIKNFYNYEISKMKNK
ncbi:NAD-dependent epimerase/dehydratase family protein [Flavobacterium sp. KACC 22761]|uniref:NAD-dependent epimerase/dehydratase family protein n=1 Tax=Flavobacterium sp. KACC 22761 TaxID=3092665 RepID=UPI002A754E7A|nr:NAD-dependent epimerase/dehydratase family protein [Flavobacterium sp. KACC 22761]WPO79528.1 NAD-dependent epimerase/dehydratase family protein [Flavobacterium sp. KACC 22761]